MDNRYDKLARLAVIRGVNVQKGQPLVIAADVRDAEFVKLCVKQAYEAGAKSVSVHWSCENIGRMAFEYEDKETLCDLPRWIYDRTATEHEKGSCYLHIESDSPNTFEGIDGEKLSAAMTARMEMMGPLRKYTMNNEGQWCIIGTASMEWAKAVFPDLDDAEAFRRLEDALFDVTLVTEDNDPVADWARHDEELETHAKIMNEYQFEKLHFTSGLGTDLWVPLTEHHIWAGGSGVTPGGVRFDANMPTEEIFCMPHCEKTEGIVYASRPLSYNGTVIEGFWFRFKDGKVVEFGAEKEEESLRTMIEMDEGSSRLGEVALVPYDSPISKSGILFFNTLYDENASCHLALGECYPENLEGGLDMDEKELRAHGGNQSIQHNDFMFGTADLSVDGILSDGTAVPVFRNGNFVF